jgi:replication factor C subunit 3/5
MSCINYIDRSKLLPWSEKYRPGTIENIIYHEKITKTIVNYMDANKLPHLLFYGPPGTGKTSSIIAIAKHYYKEDFHNMILVLNASEERGIETVRNRIKQFVTTSGLPENKTTPPFKLIILDEIDAMTEDAQAILRKVVEKYVSNVRFCFICNYLKKINPAIQSRCIIFRFKPIPEKNLTDFVLDVCDKEKIKINKNAIKLIIKRSNGDMRKLLNILQSIYMYINNSDIKTNSNSSNNKLSKTQYSLIDENDVSKILSCPTDSNIIQILKYLQENELEKSYKYISKIIEDDGISLVELISCIYEYFMDKIINNNDKIIKYDLEKCIQVIKNMSMINENLTYCNNDKFQIVSFISIFYL